MRDRWAFEHRATGQLPSAVAFVLLAAGLLSAGCIGPMNIGSVRADGAMVAWQGIDHPAVDGSLALGIEIARGKDTDPAFGPIYFAFAYSYAQTELPGHDDTVEHRAGTRWRASPLENVTSSYPYAAVGVYVGLFEPGDSATGKLGLGVEGGYGLRVGLGARAALDIDVMASYGLYEGRYEVLTTRLGGALVIRY